MSARRVGVVASVLLALSGVAACGQGGNDGELGMERMMVPNTPGGGYDLTARSVASVLESTKLMSNVDVFNVVGTNETVAMQRLMKESGNPDLMMTMGLGMVGSCVATHSDVRPSDATALADLTSEPDGIIVPADSKFATLDQLINAWRANPSAIRTGGGSSLGGPHYLFVMELAHAVGIPPRDVRYTPYAGDGPMLPALLNHTIAFGASGLGEYRDQIAAGQVRVLATSAPERLAAFDSPTLRESGIDVVFMNWHAVLAPPGISASVRKNLISTLAKMHESRQWKQALKVNGWSDAFMTGDRFAQFLKGQEKQVADELTSLGLSGRRSSAVQSNHQPSQATKESAA